ncbi:hypothetical protein [Acidithiobacillus ferrivorans]|uniref:Uncharacterized protein n=1 Tax=Acidithiobacillus ferrivorans TaxID=160808 RepID=A0A7T5BFR6_9PROT|nr:hypothetical protein [Acidithiobacillus ferrivorans]QQD71576.1 hypothetical protein H2515_08835 [Acidithiobacillus ferrivorans]
MRVPRGRLPQDPASWHGFLRDYFCDKDAVAIESVGDVHLHLSWPDEAERHVDPALQVGLRWWGRGVSLGSMWSAWRRDGRIMTSLYDTWTLLSWCEWLARVPSSTSEQVVILHVDDHRDLGSPRLHLVNGALVDAITKEEVRLTDPLTVRQAIESGAIGMGSFMTPFLWQCPQATVRHLCQPPKMQADVRQMLSLTIAPDTLLDPDAERLAIDLVEGATDTESYLGTSDTAMWSRNIEGRPALVHIDMDYFNNRYDGDSAWLMRAPRFDPNLPTMLSKVDDLINALAASKVIIEDVSIAYSPGFFPAEFWQPVDRHLRTGLARIL